MNTFGSSTQQFSLYDTRSVKEDRVRFRRHTILPLELANSFYCPSGCYPSRGWLVLARSDYNKLDQYSTTLQLNINDTNANNNVATLKNLSIVQAQCVTRGLATDPNALYLVEVTDGRGILSNKWFNFPTTSYYNIRSPAYPQTFHPGSMNAGTTWTWSTMLQNLWVQMGTFLGTWPGLPITPVGTPEGFWFPGVSAWQALCDILDHLGLTIKCDLTQASPYTIVVQDLADTTLTLLQTKYLTNLEDDLEWIDSGAARVPATVKIFFRRRNSIYGTEETVRYDSLQWDMTPLYSITVNAPAAYSSAVGEHYEWSDFTVRYDQDNNPIAADVTQANIIANQRTLQYYARIAPSQYMSQTYAGALPFTNGSKVDGVGWYMDYRGDGWAGWRTQIIYGPQPPWPDIYNNS